MKNALSGKKKYSHRINDGFYMLSDDGRLRVAGSTNDPNEFDKREALICGWSGNDAHETAHDTTIWQLDRLYVLLHYDVLRLASVAADPNR